MPIDALQPLRRKLPLLISGVLFLVVVGVCVVAYQQLKVVLVDAAGQRILGATQQLGTTLEQSTRVVLRQGRHMAADTAMIRALTRGAAPGDPSLQRLFAQQRASTPQLSRLVLLRRDGRPILDIDSARVSAPAELTVASEGREASSGPVAVGVGPLVATDRGVEYDIVTPVLAADRDTVGYVVTTRRTSSGTGGQLIGRLIGSDAKLLLGTADANVWTDLASRVAGPPSTLPVGVPSEYTAADGRRLIAVTVRLASTPWLVAVQVPRDAVLAPARRFLLTITGIAAFFLLLGVIAAWRLSRQITDPLAEIASAAEELATGNYARRAAVVRRDELGSVASAFNAMAERVERVSRDTMQREQELRATNRELRESEERYRQLVELSPEAILVHRHGTILFGNPAALRLFDPTGDGLAGRSFLDFVPPADRSAISARIRQIQSGGSATPLVERTLRRGDGTAVNVETASLPFTLGGEAAVLTLIRDVTQRRRLEEQFRQSQKMEAVGQLAGGVAHDFNNLLTVIMSYSGLLMSSVEKDGDMARDLRQISDAAERAAALTHQLLAFSRRQVLQPQVIDLNVLTERLEAMLRRLLREDIELVTRLDRSLDQVSADPGQLEQVIVNLAVNARDAMPDGGRLVIETSQAELAADSAALPAGASPGTFVVLAVSDTGHGMDEATRSKIFDPFFTTKEPGRGTGLGLSTVYGIVQQSGGTITVYSEPGLGTTFKVYLPRVAAHGEGAGAPAQRPPVPRGSETILLVEDDMRVRAAAERVLGREGYTVLLASTGSEALEILNRRREPVGLVLTDLVMPQMGGRELAQHLNARWPEIKIVFMSGYTEDAVSRTSVLAPGALFLDKPFTPDTLTRKVREALHGSAAVAAD